MISHAVRDAEYIITDSEFSKRDILRSFRSNENKIVVIPLGVSDVFRRKPAASAMLSFKGSHMLERPYILFVGNTKPHKGIETLLRAFKEVSVAYPDVDLTFVGGSLTQNQGILDIIRVYDFGRKVKSLGQLSDEELILAYWGSEMLVLPSLYEGFGLPALEAMACRVPVIVSDAASLPEVVGNAAIVCGTGKAPAFAEAMKSLLREPQLRREMIEKGERHVGKYSWRMTAQKTMDVYNKLL
jgi:Glycosyltransferase